MHATKAVKPPSLAIREGRRVVDVLLRTRNSISTRATTRETALMLAALRGAWSFRSG
jgi:hypothetical protein